MRKLLGYLLLLSILLVSLGTTVGLAEPKAPARSEIVLTTVNFYKADIVAVLQQVAAECGYNVIITPDVKGTVTLQFSQVTFEEVLKYLMQSQGLTYQREGRNFYIGKPGQMPTDQKVTGYFRLYYAEPLPTAELLKKLVPNTEIVADERTRMIIVSGSKPVIDQIGQIVSTLDRKLQQITIEVKVVEVSISALRRLGLEWYGDDSSLDWGLTSSGAELILNMINNGHTWNVIFKSLITDGNARLVSSPSVSTVEGKEAVILVGDKIPFLKKSKNENDEVEYTAEYLEVGVKLILTPWMQQNDEVSIDLKTQVNSLGEKEGDFYRIGARELNSRIQAKVGETVFLGGLITQQEREKLMKIPGISNLPLFGSFFKHNEKTTDETELIITITPKWNQPVKLLTPAKPAVTQGGSK